MKVCRRGGAFALLVPLSLLGFGCSNSSTTPEQSDAGGSTEAGATTSATFTEVYTNVIAASCSTSQCHNSANVEMSSLDMSSKPTAYTNLVNVGAAGYLCSASGDKRVVPGQPSQSLFYLKISESEPPCGFQMPFDLDAGLSESPLGQTEQTLVSDWIKGGALNN